jgi:hypothetical protein
MSRKDYVIIAAALARADRYVNEGAERAGFDAAVQALADALAGDNKRFDHERFMSAVWGGEK